MTKYSISSVILAFCFMIAGLCYIYYLNMTPAVVASKATISTPTTDRPEAKNWTWDAVFSFVPNGIRSCQQLFKGKDQSFSLPDDFEKDFKAFQAVVKSTQKVTEGYSAAYKEEMLAYYKLVKAPFVRTVCETGFNAGHSAFMWLRAKPNTRVYSFDIGSHGYAKDMASYLKEQFPGRLNVTWGDSMATLPSFRRMNPSVKCDLIIIDGGHNHKVCKSDYDNFKYMANEDNIVLLDNYPDQRQNWIKELGDVWEGGKRNGEISEIFQCNYQPQKPQGFTVGRLNVKNIVNLCPIRTS